MGIRKPSSGSSVSDKFKNDFFGGSSDTSPWSSGVLGTGTLSTTSAVEKHYGVIGITSHASNANSGARINLAGSSALFLIGGEKTTMIFATSAILTGVLRRLGFHDTQSQSPPSDGVYCKIVDGVLTGQTTNNGTISTTGTSYNLTQSTWYRLVIELNSNATLATFTLYADDSETILWTDTLAENMPTTPGRQTSHGDICTLTSPSSAVEIGKLDYMDMILPNARRVE